MSPLFRSDPFAGTHGRARELAALRVDEALSAADDAWLEEHLAGCEACSEAALGYAEQRDLFGALRATEPVPPRDLWARTAAALEAEGAGGGGVPGQSRGLRLGPMPLAPVAALMVLVIVVGAGLLNGISFFPPGEEGTGGAVALATPIALTAGQVEVLSVAEDGSLQIETNTIDEVCPLGSEACAASPQTDSTVLETLAAVGSFDEAVISPDNDHIVLLQRDGQGSGVYVVPVGRSTAGPTRTPATPAPATPAPTPEPTPAATDTPPPSDVPSGSPEATPEASPEATPEATPAATPEPATPSPSVAVTAAPDGALEIARDVILVGSASGYSADGTRFAFTARPADGSAGPDVFVWDTSEPEAHPLTTDHASVFDDWVDGRMLVSRAVDGDPVTVLLDPATGDEARLPGPAIWRPTLAPDGATAVWWDGTVAPADDGLTWRPDKGRLVLGAWPPEAAKPVVLERGKLRDWEARWNQAGTVLAVWTTKDEPGAPGHIDLYARDKQTGTMNLDTPLLAKAEAFAGFSLRDGRLVWSAPAAGGDTVVEIFAWSGNKQGTLQLPTESGVTVVR